LKPAKPVAGTTLGFHFAVRNDGQIVEQFAGDKGLKSVGRWPIFWGVIHLGDR